MKLDTSITHLIVFLASLFAVVAFVITGHEPSATAWGFIGALLGATGLGSVPAVSALVATPKASDSQGGYLHPRMFLFLLCWCALGCLALSACAGLKTAGASDPVATACVTASAAIKTLTVAKAAHALTRAQSDAVDASVPTVLNVCANPSEPSPSAASVAALEGVALNLSTLAAPFANASTPAAN